MPSNSASQFIKGMVSTGLGKIAVVLFGLLGLMITTRHLSPEDVGTFVLLTAIVIFLTELSNLGLTLALPRFMAEQEREVDKSTLVSTVVIFRMFTIVVISVVGVKLSQILFVLFGSALDDAVLLYIPALVALESLIRLITSVYQAEFRFNLIGMVNGTSSIMNFALIVLLVVLLQQGLLGLLYAKLLSRGVILIGAYLASPIRLSMRFNVKLLRSMLAFGFPLELNFVMSFIFQKMDTLLIGALLGPVYVAYYEVARRIPDALSEGYDAFIQVYFPFISRLIATGDQQKVAKLLNFANRAIVLLGLLGTAVAVAFSREIITLVFSETYAPGAVVFGLMMLNITLVMLDSNLGYTLVASGAGGKIPVINAARTVISFAGYFSFITLFGIPGAALAGTISLIAVNPLNVYFLYKRGIRVDAAAYIRALLLFGAFAFVLSLSESPAFIARAGLLSLFIVGYFAFSLVTVDDISLLRRELRVLVAQRHKALQVE